MSLAQSLRKFQQGRSSEPELLEQLDAILKDGRSSPGALLDTLDSQHRKVPLPDKLHRQILARLEQAAAALEGEDAYDATRVATSVLEEVPAGETLPPTVQPDTTDVSGEGAAQADHLPGPGDTLSDRFMLEELIGQGGMSRVFRAIDNFKVRAGSRTPEVAVKVMDVSGMAEDNAFMVVQREVQKLQSLSHENIVRVIEGYQDPSGVLFITMEYLIGQPLSRRIAQLGRNRLAMDDAMGYIRQIGLALQHAHNRGIVHADFKPSNAFITDGGKVKVIDFGIARAFQRPEDHPDDVTVFDPRDLGALTPAYASPEMIEGQDPDPRDDVYSFGCVAYELLTGRHPYARMQSTEARAEGIVPVRPTGLTRAQWRALRSALALDRARRTATIDEFLGDFLPRPRNVSWGLVGVGVAVAAALLLVLFGGNLLLPQPATDETPLAPPGKLPGPGFTATEWPAPPTTTPPGTLLKDCEGCPELVVLPMGEATIGVDPEDAVLTSESPAHQVAFQRPLAMGVSEVSLGEFRRYVFDTGAEIQGCRSLENDWQEDTFLSWANPGFEQADDHPVTCVSYRDAERYVAWLSEQTGQRYRLPSEAEWEYSARLSDAPTHLAESADCEGINVADASAGAVYQGLTVIDCNDGYVHTAPAGAGRADAFQLRHLRGNVFEWTADCWNVSHEDAPLDGAARNTGNCGYRVLRGGSWFTAPSELRYTYRNRHGVDHRANTFGFRVVREIGR